MNKSSRYLWLWVLLQACAIVVVLGWRIHRGALPTYPIPSTRADIGGQFKVALDYFSNDCGRYPTTEEGFSALINCPTNIPSGRWHGPYIDPPKIPQDVWHHDYGYRYPGIHNTNGYDLYSCGPDGISKSGGDDLDDINNWDPHSPHGGVFLDSSVGDAELFKMASALLIIPLSLGIRLIAALCFPRVRSSIAQNLTAHFIWFVMSVAVFLIFLASVPPDAGK
jgi:type II secretion system protein G